MNLSVQEWQALCMGASLALMAFAGLHWAVQSGHEAAERRKRVAVARARSKRAGLTDCHLPDGNHGENGQTACNVGNTGAA